MSRREFTSFEEQKDKQDETKAASKQEINKVCYMQISKLGHLMFKILKRFTEHIKSR